MDNEAEILIKKMMDKLNATSNKELAELIGLSAAAISRWKKYNYIDPIKKKCKELGIYNEIFGDINSQTISSNDGQIAQNVNGDQAFNPSNPLAPKKEDDDVDGATYSLFLEAYKKALKNDDLKGLRVHLMDY